MPQRVLSHSMTNSEKKDSSEKSLKSLFFRYSEQSSYVVTVIIAQG